jgi:hypothetical protein
LEYLKEAPCSIHGDPEFKAQLASMLYTYKDGKLLIQDKKTYKKTFGRSPDRADAFVLTFNPFIPRNAKKVSFQSSGKRTTWMG